MEKLKRGLTLGFFSVTLLASSFGHASLIKTVHWYKIKETGQQVEGVDMNAEEAEVWIYDQAREKITRKVFPQNELIKELSLKEAGLTDRRAVLAQTPHTSEVVCTVYRVYEDKEINFFCDETADTPFGEAQGRTHYKGSLDQSMIELLEYRGFKKAAKVRIQGPVAHARVSSTWRVKHLFANGRVVLEPGYARFLRSFGNSQGLITNIENIEMLESQ